MALTFSCDNTTATIRLIKTNDSFIITLDNAKKKTFKILSWNKFSNILIFLIENKRYKAHITTSGTTTNITFSTGETFPVSQKSTTPTLSSVETIHKQQSELLRSPLAGRIIKKYVSANQSVKKAQPLIVIESMKMENEIRAQEDSFIKTIQINEGDVVQTNQVLMTFEDENSSSNKGAK